MVGLDGEWLGSGVRVEVWVGYGWLVGFGWSLGGVWLVNWSKGGGLDGV